MYKTYYKKNHMADGLPSQDKIRGKLPTFSAMKNPRAKMWGVKQIRIL